MRVTVLGKSPPGRTPGRLQRLSDRGGRHRLLMDCGNGVFSKLRSYGDYVAVDAVVISHLHADHFLDLVPFSYALTYAPRQQPVPVDRWPGTDNPARPELLRAGGRRDTFRRVVGGWGNEDLIENAFDLREYAPDGRRRGRPAALRASPRCRTSCTPARSPCSSPNGGGRLVYGADSAPDDELVDFAQGADLLMIEATLPRPEREGMRGHLTPGEAGEHGAARRRAPPGAHPHVRRARRGLGAQRGRADLRRPGRARRRGCGLRCVEIGTSRKPSRS